MKIGIEAQRIFRKKKHGMDMVALELIRHLQEIDHENLYYIFVKPDVDDQVIQETPNFKIVKLEGGGYPTWEQISLPRAAKKYGCDILHCTSNTAPVFSSVPIMITLHDIIYMESSVRKIMKGSGSRYQKFGNLYRRMIVPKVLRRSKKVITVSDFEKDRINRFFEMDNDKRLSTVYNGVSDYFKPVTDADMLKKVQQKYHLPARFFFFLGNTDPKKNTKGTLQAFSDYRKQTSDDMKLVMIDYDKAELEKMLSEIGDKDLINHIVLTGYITNTDLPAIYSQCSLFLYPSLRESFGIPIIEAMASGAPVITSVTSSMPEISGKGAVLVDPFKPEEITTAMRMVMCDELLRTEMVTEGYAQAAKFSWRTMAADVRKMYEDIVNAKRTHSKIK